jgi:hypothetical protein
MNKAFFAVLLTLSVAFNIWHFIGSPGSGHVFSLTMSDGQSSALASWVGGLGQILSVIVAAATILESQARFQREMRSQLAAREKEEASRLTLAGC